jgi:hypothetical protein
VAPPLRVHVGDIVDVGAEKKMIGIEAVTNIASMQNIDSIRNRSAMHFPGRAVDPKIEIFVPHCPIAMLVNIPEPKPAPR